MRRELSLPEVLGMLIAVGVVHVAAVGADFWHAAATWADNSAYLEIAAAIRPWHLPDEPIVRLFWGLPYAIAGLTALLPMTPVTGLVIISVASSAAASLLVHRLYGGRVAAAMFGVFNYQWILSSFEGGSEPLFVCLLFACFLAARSDRWILASLFASLATTVRPVGVLALVGLAVTLASRRRYAQLAAITAVGLIVGVVYAVPIAMKFGSPFANVAGYQHEDWVSGWPITYPFGALIPGLRAGLQSSRWIHYVLTIAWAVLAVVGSAALWRRRDNPEFATPLPEMLFASLYVLFFLCYNAVDYVAAELPRFLLPVLPLLLYPLRDWIPNDRRVLWASALLTAVLAAGAIRPLSSIFGF